MNMITQGGSRGSGGSLANVDKDENGKSSVQKELEGKFSPMVQLLGFKCK